MKGRRIMKLAFLLLGVCVAFGCDKARKPMPQNTNSAAVKNEKASNSDGTLFRKSDAKRVRRIQGKKSKWTQSGDPIDTK